MTVEDSTVPIIGSDTEKLENGEGRRSESEEENMINKENISVEDEGMDKGGWAWVVVLGELLFITRSTIFLAVQDSSIGDLVTHSLSHSLSHVLISATLQCTAELS